MTDEKEDKEFVEVKVIKDKKKELKKIWLIFFIIFIIFIGGMIYSILFYDYPLDEKSITITYSNCKAIENTTKYLNCDMNICDKFKCKNYKNIVVRDIEVKSVS